MSFQHNTPTGGTAKVAYMWKDALWTPQELPDAVCTVVFKFASGYFCALQETNSTFAELGGQKLQAGSFETGRQQLFHDAIAGASPMPMN